MKDITIDVGVDTLISIDLRAIEVSPENPVYFTIKNAPFSKTLPIVKRELKTKSVHAIYVSPEESLKMLDNAEYDFSRKIIDADDKERTIKITDNGKIRLRRGVGGGIY